MGAQKAKMLCLQTEPRLLKKEVGNLRMDTTILNNNFQSAEVLLNTIQTDTKLFKKEIAHLKKDTSTLFNTTWSTEFFL